MDLITPKNIEFNKEKRTFKIEYEFNKQWGDDIKYGLEFYLRDDVDNIPYG